MTAWTIAPTSSAPVEPLLRRLKDLAVVDAQALADGCAPAERAAVLAALVRDLRDALGAADGAIAELASGPGGTPAERRAHCDRLALASRLQRHAAQVAEVAARLGATPRE